MKQTNVNILILTGLVLGSPILFPKAMAQDIGKTIYIEKQAQYNQTSTSEPTLDGQDSYQFDAFVAAGTSGTLLTTSSLTPPPGSADTVTFTNDASGDLFFTQQFGSKADLDAAFLDSTTDGYDLTVNTSTPNTYTASLNLGPDNYPATIPELTNTNWSGGSLLLDATQNFTFTWNGFTGLHLQLTINGTIVDGVNNPNGTETSFTLAADTLAPDTFYQINDLSFSDTGGTSDSTSIPGSTITSAFNNNMGFSIMTEAIPEPGAAGSILTGGVVSAVLASRKRQFGKFI